MFNLEICQKARLSRDARFDGKFFIAVKTTGIYCRTICPAQPPKEENVLYFASAVECATSGFRPCLRCRPDSAPQSPAWQGVNATLNRAKALIDEGVLQNSSLPLLAERLGITDRYLRALFNKHLGVSPKSYALYQQCLFAKQLLHETKLPITQVALASGFSSIRRFNDCFQQQLKLTPSAMRKSSQALNVQLSQQLNNQLNQLGHTLKIKLYYRPPFNWSVMQKTLSSRAIAGLEWCTQQSYGRSFELFDYGDSSGTSLCKGHFTAIHVEEKHCFNVSIELSDIKHLKVIINNIRRILDLNVDMQAVEQDLKHCFIDEAPLAAGIRLPGIWSMFEAGVRAILGQHISVTAARNLVSQLVESLGVAENDKCFFPTPKAIANSELAFFKIPGARKQALRNLAQHYLDYSEPDDPKPWLELKGIGPWTTNYAKMRGLSDPDVFLVGDLGVKKAMKYLKADATTSADKGFNAQQASPWGSYLTFQLWNLL